MRSIDISIRFFNWGMLGSLVFGAIAGIGFGIIESIPHDINYFLTTIGWSIFYGAVIGGCVVFFALIPIGIVLVLVGLSPLGRNVKYIYFVTALGIAIVDALFIFDLLTSTREDYAQIIDLVTYNYKYVLVALPCIVTFALSISAYKTTQAYQASFLKDKRKPHPVD